MIVTSQSTKRPTLPTSKRPGALIYETGKFIAQKYGFYKDIQQYDPGYYFDKYSYKPRKRIAGYLGQKLHEKKKKFGVSSTGYKFYQKPSGFSSRYNGYIHRHPGCEGSQFTCEHNHY